MNPRWGSERAEAFVLQDAKRLPDGDPARVERRCEVLLAKAGRRREDTVEDGLAEGLEDQRLGRLVLRPHRPDERGQLSRVVAGRFVRDGHA